MIRDTDIEMLKMLSEGHPQKTIAAAISWSPSAVHRRLRERVYPALGAMGSPLRGLRQDMGSRVV